MPNSTINFTTDRINRKPAVFRGMTMLELVLLLGSFAAIGAVSGILLMIVGLGFYIIFVMAFVFMAIGVKLGGAYIARLKRGKPESYFEAWVDFKQNPQNYITASQKWRIRRSKKGK